MMILNLLALGLFHRVFFEKLISSYRVFLISLLVLTLMMMLMFVCFDDLKYQVHCFDLVVMSQWTIRGHLYSTKSSFLKVVITVYFLVKMQLPTGWF